MTEHLLTVDQLAVFTLAQQHPRTAEWGDERRRLARLADDHGDDLDMVTDMELARFRRGLFAPHLPVDALLNRWLNVTDGLEAMLSMRWEGGDARHPFVDASVLSRAPRTADDLAALAQIALDTFGLMKPRYVRVWSAAPANHFLETEADKRVLAAPLAVLKAGRTPAGLALGLASEIDHYDDALVAYRAVDTVHPDHRGQAAFMDRDAAQRRCDDGLLFEISLNGDWCGYVAVRRGAHLGLDGFGVTELILAPAARGHGLGAHISTLLALALPDTDGVLSGTVHANNRGAMTAAQAAGRADVGGWFQVPLDVETT